MMLKLFRRDKIESKIVIRINDAVISEWVLEKNYSQTIISHHSALEGKEISIDIIRQRFCGCCGKEK